MKPKAAAAKVPVVCNRALEGLLSHSFGDLQVLELQKNGDIREVTCTPDQLGLSPRDVGVFAESRTGKTAQRATIVPRSGAILFRTEIARAVVRHDHVWLFPCR